MPEPVDGSSLEAMAGFARSVNGAHSAYARLELGVRLAVDLLDGCDHAGVTILRQGELTTAASSDDLVRRADAWQRETNDGPALGTVEAEATVLSQDLAAETRWPTWTARIRDELGVRALLALLLFSRRDASAAVTLYADRAEVWDSDQLAMARALAGQLAVAFEDAHETEHRGRAMIARTVIGQAQGILMQRHDLTVEHAYARLLALAGDDPLGLAAVAEEIVRTRRIPGE